MAHRTRSDGRKRGRQTSKNFKFNATGVVVGDMSVTQTFAGQTLQPQTGAFNGDGTGTFTFGIACTTCGNGNLGITSNIVFSIANATIADVTAPNNLGQHLRCRRIQRSNWQHRAGGCLMPCPARLPGQASRVWSWLAAVLLPSRDAVVSSSPERVGSHSYRLPMSLQACWPSTVSTLLL